MSMFCLPLAAKPGRTKKAVDTYTKLSHFRAVCEHLFLITPPLNKKLWNNFGTVFKWEIILKAILLFDTFQFALQFQVFVYRATKSQGKHWGGKIPVPPPCDCFYPRGKFAQATWRARVACPTAHRPPATPPPSSCPQEELASREIQHMGKQLAPPLSPGPLGWQADPTN